jgi:hypothetical protein
MKRPSERRVLNLGDEPNLHGEYLTPREHRLAGLPLDAPTYSDLRDKKRARRTIRSK